MVSLCICFCGYVQGQSDWTWTELPTMPMPVANNAVVAAQVDGVPYVYSFGGIDTTKLNSGIVQSAMRYSTQDMTWEFINDLPDTLGKIASSANVVNNMIYIIGGYHVFDGAPFELSSDRVHRYDPETNTYLADGAPIPVAIDDQVQAVWRDSLIFVVTGWSDVANVPDVQIYDPANDAWQVGSPLPNSAIYTAFGAAGEIVGDTIYYYGGASGSGFAASKRLRRGVINPANPTQIDWEFVENSPGDAGYRTAAVTIEDKVFWIGGSGIAYNFDGIAYNGSGGVPPLFRILEYDAADLTWNEGLGQDQGIMDLRGAAQISETSFVIAGGMESEQSVTNRVFRLDYTPQPDDLTEYGELAQVRLYPTKINSESEFYLDLSQLQSPAQTSVSDLSGKTLMTVELNHTLHQLSASECNITQPGIYLISVHSVDFTRAFKILIDE